MHVSCGHNTSVSKSLVQVKAYARHNPEDEEAGMHPILSAIHTAADFAAAGPETAEQLKDIIKLEQHLLHPNCDQRVLPDASELVALHAAAKQPLPECPVQF